MGEVWVGKLNKWRYNDANDILTLIFHIKTRKTLSCLCRFMLIIYITAAVPESCANAFSFKASLLGRITNNRFERHIIGWGAGNVRVALFCHCFMTVTDPSHLNVICTVKGFTLIAPRTLRVPKCNSFWNDGSRLVILLMVFFRQGK